MKTKVFILLSGILLFSAFADAAQFQHVSADQVKSWVDAKRKLILVDARFPEEYEAAHIPGAINIPAERMQLNKSRLSKDKSIKIIFYCNGIG